MGIITASFDRQVKTLPKAILCMSANEPSDNGRSFFNFLRREPAWQEVSGYHVGDIHTEQGVWLMTGSTLVGNVTAARVRVDGLFYGTITAPTTAVRPGGQVWGDVNTERLEIEPGGKVHGWVSTLGPATSPEPDDDHPLAARDHERQDALQRLQQQTAVALAARAELEQTFDQRLADMAGDANQRAAKLEEQATLTREELDQLRPELDRLRTELDERDNHISQQAAELLVARSLLAERQRELDLLAETHTDKLAALDALAAEKTAVDTDLDASRAEIDTLHERQRNLEGALQASLQHTAELDESLVRWQELAETMETRVAELEKEAETLRLQVSESASVTDRLREQRNHAKESWETAMAELLVLRAALDDSGLKQQVAELEEQLAAQTALAEERQTAFDELTNRTETEAKQHKATLAKLQRELEQTRMRLDTSETEAEQAWQQADAQGKRLSELQAVLVERDLQIRAAKETAVKQTKLVKQMRKVSSQQVSRLKDELESTRARLKQLETIQAKKSA